MPQSTNKKSKIIAITNQKGGCGKTTTAINLSSALSRENFKVLIVDIDPQAHSTLGLGINPDSLKSTIFNLLIAPCKRNFLDLLKIKNLLEKNKVPNTVLNTSFPNLDILPSNVLLSGAEVVLTRNKKRGTILSDTLDKMRHRYDFIIIDCPPSLGVLTLSALVASDAVIIPVQTHYFALEGTKQLLHSIDIVRQRFNSSLEIMGIVATLHDENAGIGRDIIHGLKEFFKDGIFNTVIRLDSRIVEASSKGEPIHFYAPDSEGARDYLELAKEVIQKC